jgi:hypothetical protein
MTKTLALESFVEQEHGAAGPRADPDMLAALDSNLRNVLNDRERLALKMWFTPTPIGGARVLRRCTVRGYVLEPGRWLAADEVTNIEPCNLRALVDNGFLKLYPWSAAGEKEPRNFSSSVFEGTNTLARIAKAIGARDASHAGKIVQRALSKLRRRATNPRERKKIRKEQQ